MVSYLSVEFEPADAQVHPGEALVSSDGVDLNELVLPYGGAHRPVRLVVVQVEGFLQHRQSFVCVKLGRRTETHFGLNVSVIIPWPLA